MLFLSLSLMVDDIPLAIKALATTGNRESAYHLVIGCTAKVDNFLGIYGAYCEKWDVL